MKVIVYLCTALLLSTNIQAEYKLVPTSKLYASSYISMGGFSPDGKYLVAIINEVDNRHLGVVNTTTNEIIKLEDIGTARSIEDFDWFSNRKIYLKLTNRGRVEEFIVEFSDNANEIVSSAKGIPSAGFIVDIFKSAPDHVLFARRKDFKEPSYELIHIKIDDLLNKNFDAGIEYGKPSGRVIHFFYDSFTNNITATIRSKESDKVTLKYRKLKTTRWKKLLSFERGDYTFKAVNFMSNRSIAVLTNKDADKIGLYEYNLDKQAIVREIYTHPDYDLTGVTMLANGKGIEKVTYLEHGRYTSHYLTPTSEIDSDTISKALPDMQWLIASTHEKSKVSLIRSYSSYSPGAFYLYKADSNEMTKISSLMPELDDYTFARNKQVTVKIDDKTNIEAFLTLPVQNSVNVLLVMPHGGPIGIRDHDYFSREVQFLANRGFSVLRVNYRGSGGFGKAFLKSGVAQFGKQIESDITAAVDLVRKEHTFNKVCTIGSSYGGYSSLMLPIQHPETYDCAVATYGIFDLPLLFNSSNIKVLEDYRNSTEAVVGKNDEALFDVSPVYSANKIQIPVLLIGGRDDPIADFEHTFRMYYMLDKYKKNVETLFYDNVGHGQSSWKGEMHESAYIVDYLYRVLELPTVYDSELTADEKQSLAIDYARLADSFGFESNLGIDKNKAFALYKVAAKLEHDRATFNVGTYHEQGEVGQKNIDEAIKWYRKAADLGYATAYSRLGNIFYDGLGVEADHKLAMSYFEKAQQMGSKAEVLIKMADAYCYGHGVEENIEYCFDLLKLDAPENKVSRKTRAVRNQQIAKLVLDESQNPEVIKYFKRYLAEKYDAQVFAIEKVRAIRAKPKSTLIINFSGDAINQKQRIGNKFKLIPQDDSIRKDMKPTALLYRWTSTDKQGNTTTRYQSIANISQGEINIFYNLSQAELQPAMWSLELFNIEGQLIETKNYPVNFKDG